MTVFRPPKLPDDPKQLKTALGTALMQIYEDLRVLAASAGDVSIAARTYQASVGEVKRVSPPAVGMGFVLPPPSADNRARTITALIENAEGDLRVFVAPGDGASATRAATVDGAEMATFDSDGAVVFTSNGVDRWSSGPGGPAGVAGATGATGPAGADSAMRRLYKEVYYADGSCEIYDSDDALISSSTLATWSPTSSSKTAGNRYYVWVVPGGPSGARGSRSSSGSGAPGPGGSGGGALADDWFDRVFLEAFISGLGTDVPVTVGAGGASVAGLSASNSATNGAAGNPGAASSFGTLLHAHPGAAGVNVTSGGSSGSSGGGVFGPGNPAGTLSGTGGRPVDDISGAGLDADYGGGAGGTNATTTAAGASIFGGGGGGGGQAAGSAAAGNPGGRSLRGAPGSGAGGNVSGSGATANNGAAGGRTGYASDGLTAGGGGTAGVAPGGDGGDGADGEIGKTCGAAGGGGAGRSSASAGQSSGAGGDGGFPGGPGAPSGSGTAQSATVAIAASGKGANGCVAVFTYA